MLDTQSAQSSAIQQFSSDLDLVTAQLRDSDPDLRRLIDTGTDASDQNAIATEKKYQCSGLCCGSHEPRKLNVCDMIE